MVSGECRGIPTSPLTMCAKRPPGTGIRRAGGWWKGKFQFVRRPWICRATQVRQVVRFGTLNWRVSWNRPHRIRPGSRVPMLDSPAVGTILAGDVTDRPGGRAGARKSAEGSGSKSRAAPATVTGEAALQHATGPVREGGAAVRIREPGDLSATVVRRRAGCTGSQRSARYLHALPP